MQIREAGDVRVMRFALVVVALGLFCAPWLFDYSSHSTAAWSSWTLAALYSLGGAVSVAASRASAASALLALGLWTLLAPGVLSFDMTNPAAFWTHTLAGLVALAWSYAAFQDVDPGGMRTS